MPLLKLRILKRYVKLLTQTNPSRCQSFTDVIFVKYILEVLILGFQTQCLKACEYFTPETFLYVIKGNELHLTLH